VDQILEVEAPASFSELLAGRAPGANVQLGSGIVGIGGPVRIRGTSTLSLAGDPLIYVDGVRVDNASQVGPPQHSRASRLNDFNPEDIESIEIIKGPAAATLYGTEASNGVIQIITKKGRLGETRIDLTFRQGVNWFMNPGGRIEPNYSIDTDGTVIRQHLWEEENAAGRDIFRRGHIQSYNVNVRGGEERFSYYLSLDVDDEEGIYPNNQLTKIGARINLSTALSDNLDIEANIGFVNNDTELAGEGFTETMGVIPSIVFGIPLLKDTPTRGFLNCPPETCAEVKRFADVDRTTVSVQATHRPLSWLTHRLIIGTDMTDDNSSQLYPRLPPGSPNFWGGRSTGEKTIWRRRATNQTFDYGATAAFELSPTVNSTTSFGVQYYGKKVEEAQALGRDLPSPVVSTVSAAAVSFGDESFLENNTVGGYGQQQFAFNDRIFVTGALRADANSAFGENFEAVFYPKVSATWVVSDEPFWNVGLVNQLRLRGAWGMSGLQPDVFAAIRTYQPVTGPGDEAAVTPGNIGNPDLEPEKGQELELGLDAGLFDDRFAVQFTYYAQRTKDAILLRNVAPSEGFPGSQFVNIGELSNKGIEIQMDARPLAAQNVVWDLGLSVSKNTNRIESLGGLPPIAAGAIGTQWHYEGYPVGGFWDQKVVQAERDANGDIVNVLCAGGPENNDQPVSCDVAPPVYLGPPGPTWEGGFRNTLSLFRNLQLHAQVIFQFDSRRFNITSWGRDVIIPNGENTVKRHEKTLDPIMDASWDLGEPWVERDDFIKLRELSATYTLPSQVAERFGASRASISIAGRNLAYWAHPEFRDFDPEMRRTGNTSGARQATWSHSTQSLTPQLASVVMTVRLTF
jgi:TonB-linked SusC/RagA family outer membrane protein